MIITVSALGANIRSSTNISSSNIIRVEPQGKNLQVLGKVAGQVVNSSNIWYQVAPSGYVHSSVVVISQSLKPQLQAFLKKYLGKPMDYDGGFPKDNPYQCMDLMHYWHDAINLYLPPAANPWALWNNYNGTDFRRVLNGPNDIPLPGDVLIWKPWAFSITAGLITGSAGHVAVFNEGDWDKVNSADQNWPTGSYCHLQDHIYTGIVGWFTPAK